MSTTQTLQFVSYNDRAHRATCKKVAGREVAEVSAFEAVLLTPASCCKPAGSPEWKAVGEAVQPAAEETVADGPGPMHWEAEELTEAPVVVEEVSSIGHTAKHFWLGLARNAARYLTEACGLKSLEVDTRTYYVVRVEGREDEVIAFADTLTSIWDAANEALPAWRTEQEPRGYRTWALKRRLEEDRRFLDYFSRGAVAGLFPDWDGALYNNAAEVAESYGYLAGVEFGRGL